MCIRILLFVAAASVYVFCASSCGKYIVYMSHPLEFVRFSNLQALHSVLTALGKLQLKAVRFPTNAH